ncbi:hypothetical protein DRF65_00485 [Chryseobacterium pennae]|uniref:Uncharacterized protein n=1 Tax=Chryseobacterium pennae TaxID=2258962 RepID=A0A3D9CE84_9FLAO|nr:hypothetical protein [Chryseobacterium pennae]REC64087.1 hypothetical protein DRF65_00485 [Chryseobacterium pennae]
MKKILLLLLFPTIFFSQTSLTNDDIYAAVGNEYETLLTNIGIDREGGFAINHFLHKMGFTPDEKFTQNSENFKQKYIQQIVSGNAKPTVIWVSYLNKKVKGYNFPITQKVDISGDTENIIKFYVNFWSRAINFKDTKPGETVTIRFLSDVAALSVGTNGQSKIVVTSAKDYYK